jgi:hypothetical protein
MRYGKPAWSGGRWLFLPATRTLFAELAFSISEDVFVARRHPHPAIVRWPGVVPGGKKVTSQAAVTMDWSATFLDVARAKADPDYPFDGESMMAVCAGSRPAFDRTISGGSAPNHSGRAGRESGSISATERRSTFSICLPILGKRSI